MRFLFVDRIVELLPGSTVRGIKHITRDDYYLSPDARGRLCFTPSLIGETLGQLAAWSVMVSQDFTKRPVAGVVSSAKLHRPAYVGDTLLLESFIDSLDENAVQYHSIARVSDEVVFSIEGALGPLLPMDDFIDPAIARRQFAEIDRPGDWLELCTTTKDSIPLESPIKGHPDTCPLFLFDRITLIEPGIQLRAEKRITRAAAYFPDHFPSKPVLPMTVLLECKINLAREFMALSGFPTEYYVHEMRKIKMNDFVFPGDVVVSTVKVKHRDAEELVLSYRSEVNGKRVCVMDMVMLSKGAL